jgi:hypothetical protein
MSLNTILEKIKVQQPFADEDVDSGPRATLSARRGRKSRAVEEVKQLKEDYANELRKTTAFVLVIGDQRDEFVSIANDSFKTFSTDPNTFYTDLVDRVPPGLYLGKESLPNMFDVLGRYLEDKMLEFVGQGVRAYNQLIFRQNYSRSITTREEFLAVVRQALVEQVGAEVVGIQAVHSLTNEAIKREYVGKFFAPILLPTNDERFALTVAKDLEKITNRIFVVRAGNADLMASEAYDVVVAEPTKDSVKKALKTISTKSNK